MGRKRRGEASEGTKKKHKKNKHKKHYSLEEDVTSSGNDGLSGDIKRPIKLKIKLGDQLISSSNAIIESPLQGSVTGDDASSLAESDSRSYGASLSSIAGGVGESSVLDITGGSSLGLPEEELVESDLSMGKEECDDVVSNMDENEEEEAWLDALETGEVDERGYLPQKLDVSSLTTRQRAMLGGEGGVGTFEELMELPTGRATEELTEEMLLKKTERNRKRRIAAQKRKEKRKTETVRRLLEKQTTKKKEEEKTKQPARKVLALRHIRYVNSASGSSLSLPQGMDLPSLATNRMVAPPVPVLCAVRGCKNTKKYSDSASHQPVCSLACYRALHSRGMEASTRRSQTRNSQSEATVA